MKEKQINIIDVIVNILLHWRTLLVWMIVGGVILGGYSYYNSMQTVKQQASLVENQKDAATALEELENMLTLAQRNNVDMVLQYETFEEYYNQSELLKVNPAEIPCSKLLYMVKSDSVEESNNIRQIYESAISVGFLQWLEKNKEEDISNGINELIIVNGDYQTLTNGTTILMQEECTPLEISVVHSSTEECTKLSSYLKEYIEAQAVEQKSKLSNHELVYISESFEVVADSELLKTQKYILDNIKLARADSKAIKDKFTSIESRYYELKSADPDNSIETAKLEIQSPSVSMKYIALGMVVFGFLYAFFLFVVYVMNTKIRATDDMSTIFAIDQLGTLSKVQPKKQLLGKVDFWIYKIQNRNKRIFSKEEELGLIISALKIVAKKNNLSEMLCMGTAWSEMVSEIATEVKLALAQEGIAVQFAKNVLYDRESMELLEGATGAFLLECANVTLYDEVQKELELLQRQEIKCLGIVVVEV